MKKLISILFVVTLIFVSCDDDDSGTIDYVAFDEVVNNAKELADVNKEGEGEGDLIIGSTAILNEQIIRYEAYRETAVNQGTLDNGTRELNAAIDTYIASVVVISNTALIDVVSSSQAIHDAAIEGTEEGEYLIGSKEIFQAAIDEAQLVVDNENSTQAEINTASVDLTNATVVFNSGLILPLDLVGILESINSAQGLHDGATEGTEVGDYAVNSKVILQAAIDSAQTIVDDSDATQVVIDEAKATLDAAVLTFQEGRVLGEDRDLTILMATVLNAQTLQDAAIEGTERGQYTVGSKATFQIAIDEANAIIDDLNANQPIVDQANVDLEAAIVIFNAEQIGTSALRFATGSFVEATGFTGITGGNERTMEAWIKTASTTDATGVILSWGVNESGQKWDMRVTGAGNLRIENNGGNSVHNAVINDDTWHHVAVVVPAGASMAGVILYVDGVSDKRGSGDAAILTSDANNFWIGRSTGQPERFFDGVISDVRIWDVARSEAEIQAGMSARLTGTESGLVGYWKLDEGAGETTADSGSGSNEGILSNDPTFGEGLPLWVKVVSGLPF